MTLNQRNIAYVINTVILVGVVVLVSISENLHSATETKPRAEESKHSNSRHEHDL